MASSMFIDAKLISLVERATCVQDLTPLLNVIFGVAEMKNLVKQKLSTMYTQQKQSLYAKASPMDDVLPEHIVQYMIGFTDLRNLDLVNKSFQKCCNSVKRLVIRQYETNWQKEFNDLSDFSKNKIINVYPSQHYNHLPLAIQHAQSGDTLLLYPGTYIYYDAMSIDKSIKLIGYNSNVIIETSAFRPLDTLDDIVFSGKYTYLQNLRLDVHDYVMNTERDGSSLYMEDCIINFDSFALHSGVGTKTVKIRNCVMNGEYGNDSGLLFFSRPELLEIESCIFRNCCRNGGSDYSHCIVLHTKMSGKQAKFKCVANRFENNFGLPIVAEHPHEINQEDTQILNNTWCYNHKIVIPELRDDKVNPNEIYPFTRIQMLNQ
eukprot:221967_1